MTDETQSWLALSTLLRLRSDGSGYYIQGTAQSLYYGAKPQLPTALIIDLVRLQLTSIVISFSTLNTVLIQHQSQLLNRPLYAEDVLALQTLCSTICDSVLNDRLAHHARHLAPFQRGDVYRPVLSHLLALAAAYRHIFSKHQQDEIVLCFATGLHRWTTTIQQCIHALTILALILPLSTAKHLPSILLRYQQIMSGPSTSVHILEFLSTLARNHTSLHRDFVDEDFRRVLGIAMQYIASHREQLAVAHGRLGVATAAFSQYVLNLAYQVIVAWLLCLKPMERLRLRPFVVRGLMAPYKKDDGDMAEVDEKTEACLETVFWLTAAESEGAEESRPMDGSAATVKPQSQKFICGDMATLTLSYYDGSSVHAQIRRTVGTREWWFVMGSDATRALQALRTALLPAHIVDLNGIAPLPSVEGSIEWR